MEVTEYLRTITDSDSGNTLHIFRILAPINLSEYSICTEKGGIHYKIPLPSVDIELGDFLWISNINREDMPKLVSNTSRTNTLVCIIDKKTFPLDDVPRFEKKKE